MRAILVDDNTDLRDLTRESFDVFAPGAVTVAAECDTGEECLDALESCSADVVIVDWQMTGMDGIETTQAVKRDHPDVRVVAFSSGDSPDVRAAFAQAGADAFFPRHQFRELLAWVREHSPLAQRQGLTAMRPEAMGTRSRRSPVRSRNSSTAFRAPAQKP
jgi:DNA-binding NarL/FixJ family response regulator